MHKITPFLWCNGQAEESARFYTSIFKHSRIESVSPMSSTYYLDGQKFMALNGGPQFTFTETISFFVHCETQAEVDELWEKLSAGGTKQMCGWLKDQFGVSWQIIPSVLGNMLQDEDEEKSQRVMNAMLKMHRIEISGLQRAYEGR